jgi:Fe-S-cluster containining protein
MRDLTYEWKLQKTASYQKFKKVISRLKIHRGKKLDVLADKIHKEVFSEIHCLDCANCCSQIPPILNRTDVSRISKHLGLKEDQFYSQYVKVDEDGDTVMQKIPCPFLLEDHSCSIYEFRPRACREYPHTDQMEFSGNMKLHLKNVAFCPGVFHILSRIETRFLK